MELTAARYGQSCFMQTLVQIRRDVDRLSVEDKASLACHLLSILSDESIGADDEEADRRDHEMDAGQVQSISHSEFLRQARP